MNFDRCPVLIQNRVEQVLQYFHQVCTFTHVYFVWFQIKPS